MRYKEYFVDVTRKHNDIKNTLSKSRFPFLPYDNRIFAGRRKHSKNERYFELMLSLNILSRLIIWTEYSLDDD
jgi:hypothetical protein